MARAGHHVVARSHSRRGEVRRDDDAHRLLVNAGLDGGSQGTAYRRDEGQQRQGHLLRQHRQQCLHPGQGRALGAEVLGLYRWRELQGTPRGHRRGREGTVDQHRLEIHLDSQGHLARPGAEPGAIGAIYNLTMDPFEKYDMAMPASMSARLPKTSPGSWTGQDNAWVLSLVYPVLIDFNKSIMKYPSIKRFPGGASTDLMPNLQNPANPVPALDPNKMPKAMPGGD